MKKKKQLFISTLLLIQLVLLILVGCQKQGMHFDEYYSYFTTNNSDGRAVNDRQWLSGGDMKKDFFVQEGEQFHYGKVIELQSYDVHPPVFYLLLHTVCSLTPGIYSIWQGLALNILYALITTVFLYLILEKLIRNQRAAFFVSLVCITNPGVISNVMFIRMYMLLTMWMVLAIWLHLGMGEKWHWKFFVLNGALAYVGFLTHYYYLVFLFFSGGGVLAAQTENGMETVSDLWREHAGSGHPGGTELSGMSGTYFCWVSWKTGNRESSESDGYTGEVAVFQRINE